MSLIPWNAPLTVNTTTNGNQTYPTIAQLKDGSMVVTWTDISSGNGDVKFQRYDAADNKLGGETLSLSNIQWEFGINHCIIGGMVKN